METGFGVAILITAAAGLSTTFGSVIALFVRRPGPRVMAATLGFAAGVMIMVSFVELLPRATGELGVLPGYLAFFAGMAAMWLVDVLIPHDYIAERSAGREGSPRVSGDDALRRTGLMVALGIGIHNFPEGMATLGAALEKPELGVAVAVAIALHNIPEGLAVSVPVYAATGSRAKAFKWSFLSGIAEPVGAGVAGVALLPVMTPAVLAAVLGVVAGLMVYIALDELMPSSREYGHDHLSIIGAGAGMAVMAASLWLLGASASAG